MNCQAARALFDLYRDGRLSGARAGEMSAHLEGCAACREQALPTTKPAVGITAPDDLKKRLRQSLAAAGSEDKETAAVGAGEDMRSLPLATLTLIVAWVGLMWLAHAATAMWPSQQGDAAGQAFTVRRLP